VHRSFVLVLVVLELIRSRRLRERYALLWLVTGIALTILSAWREGLNTIAGWFGVRSYPPAVLFAVGLLFILAVLLHYSTVISRLSIRTSCSHNAWRCSSRSRALTHQARSRRCRRVQERLAALDDLLDQIHGRCFRLLEDPGDVLADDAHSSSWMPPAAGTTPRTDVQPWGALWVKKRV